MNDEVLTSRDILNGITIPTGFDPLWRIFGGSGGVFCLSNGRGGLGGGTASASSSTVGQGGLNKTCIVWYFKVGNKSIELTYIDSNTSSESSNLFM